MIVCGVSLGAAVAVGVGVADGLGSTVAVGDGDAGGVGDGTAVAVAVGPGVGDAPPCVADVVEYSPLPLALNELMR